MSSTGDLINISYLVRTDTFNNWLLKTNNIIENLNPLQVYDVNVGTTGGLLKQTGISAGNYNGVITLSVNPGPGIGTTNLYGGITKTVIDYSLFDYYGLSLSAANAVSTLDEYIINDVSDTSLGPNGTVKKIRASKILPYSIDDDHQFEGNIIIVGDLSVLGENTFIGANNLRIEDKQIELAYQQGLPLTLTGVTGGSYTASNFGMTAYYYQNSGDTSPYLHAQFNSYTGSTLGPTGTFYIGSPFQDPYDADSLAGLTGYISLHSDGSQKKSIYHIESPFNDFLSDSELSEGGIVLKGASGDKQLIWIDNDPDTGLKYNAWISNVGVGLSGAWSPFIGRIYRSFGYDGVTGYTGSNFIFAAQPNEYLQIQLTEFPIGGTHNGQFSGGWVISKVPDNGSYQNTLKFWYSDTNIIDNKNISFSLYGSASAAGGTGENWRAYSGITTSSFAQGFNADQLDGAHGYTGSRPYSIPISDAYGLVDSEWLEASTVRRRIVQTSHGLTFGNVIRVNTSGKYVTALGNSPANAETLGIVSSVSGDSFVITMQGLIRGLTGPSMIEEGITFVAGNVYFLSGNNTGKLVSDPDLSELTRIPSGGVRKPMLIATSETEGYVLDYLGTVVENPTDELYLGGLVPIGTIYPYAGDLQYLSSEWVVCDGKKYNQSSYPDLYRVLNNKYFVKATFSGTTTCTVTDDTRNLEVGDVITITNSSGISDSRTISSLTTTTITVSGSAPVSGTYEVRITENSSGTTQFFIPDLRDRFIKGQNSAADDIASIAGATSVTLINSNLPSHTHGLGLTTAAYGFGTSVIYGSGTDTNAGTTGSGTSFSIVPRNLATYYIIRAKSSTKATILTGHNHDNRYIRFDGTHAAIDGLTYGSQSTFRENAKVSGIALGSSLPTFGGTHDHDRRYVRYDSSQTLTSNESYVARHNIVCSALAEGNGYSETGLTHNHDGIYIRYDGAAQSISPTLLSGFRNKIGVYSKTESDDNYVDIGGDVMSGNLTMDDASIILENGDIWSKRADSSNHFFSSPSQGRFEIYSSNFKVYDENNNLFINAITGAGNVENQYQILHKGTPIWDTFVTKVAALGAGNSRMESYFFGDLTVWPDGYTGGSDTSPILRTTPVFGIDPIAARAFIMGSLPKENGTRTNPPSLDFYDASNVDPFNTPAGTAKITGLTFPTASHHAANKQYVDQSHLPCGNVTTTTTSYTITGLTSGSYFLTAFINQTVNSNSLTATVNSVSYGLGAINSGNTVTFNCVVENVTTSINIAVDSGSSDPIIRHVTYFRIGS